MCSFFCSIFMRNYIFCERKQSRAGWESMKRLLCSNFKSKRRFCSFFCDPCFFYRKSFLFSCVRTSIPSALGLDLFPFLFQIDSFFFLQQDFFSGRVWIFLNFSASFRWKISLWIFLDYSIWHFCCQMYNLLSGWC